MPPFKILNYPILITYKIIELIANKLKNYFPEISAGFADLNTLSKKIINITFGKTKINEITAALGLTKSCPKAEYKIVGIVIKSGAPIIKAIANSSIDKIKTIRILAKMPDFNEGRYATLNT